MSRPDGVFHDEAGQKWEYFLFRRSSVGAWWSDEQLDWSRKAAVVFRRKGEERVAVVDWDVDLSDATALDRLFASARERRSGRDRRNLWIPVRIDRRVEGDRRFKSTR